MIDCYIMEDNYEEKCEKMPYSSIYTISQETKPNKVAKVISDLVMTCT